MPVTRRDFLEELLTTVFYNVGANYKEFEGTYELVNTSGIADKHKYESGIAERCRMLFEVALLKEISKYDVSKKHELSKEIILENCTKYFNKHAIDITETYEKQRNNPTLSRAFYSAIANYIIPVIFQNKGTDCDDIGTEMSSAFHKVKGLFWSYKNGHMKFGDIRANEVMRLEDSDFEKSRYNYAVPASKLAPLTYPWICSWLIPGVRIKADSMQTNALKTHSTTELTDGFFSYPLKINQLYYEEYGLIAFNDKYVVNSTSFEYMILNTQLPSLGLPSDFIYVTCVDDIYRRELQRQGITEQGQLIVKLRKSVQRDMKKRFNDELERYYKSVLESITEFLEKLLTIDLTPFIQRDDTSMDECIRILTHFNIDAQKLVDYLISQNEKNNNGTANVIWQAYNLLENILCEFIGQMENQSGELIVGLKECLSKIMKEEFVENIRNYINSQELRDAINIQEGILKPNPSIFERVDNSVILISCISGTQPYHKNIFQWLKEILNHYIMKLS